MTKDHTTVISDEVRAEDRNEVVLRGKLATAPEHRTFGSVDFCRMLACYGVSCCYGNRACCDRVGVVPSWRHREIQAVGAGPAHGLGGSRTCTWYSSRPAVPALSRRIARP